MNTTTRETEELTTTLESWLADEEATCQTPIADGRPAVWLRIFPGCVCNLLYCANCKVLDETESLGKTNIRCVICRCEWIAPGGMRWVKI